MHIYIYIHNAMSHSFPWRDLAMHIVSCTMHGIQTPEP